MKVFRIYSPWHRGVHSHIDSILWVEEYEYENDGRVTLILGGAVATTVLTLLIAS
jgi:hypothetical protein